jgi:alpha-amylase
MGNDMQNDAMRSMYELQDDIIQTGNNGLIEDWRRLLTSDHAYYMCTKWFSDGDVHAYFSPYESPYDAFMYFMNAYRDVTVRVVDSNQIHGGENS